ncbi:hypothetical protein Dimus_039432 [Dionaea muscipula]
MRDQSDRYQHVHCHPSTPMNQRNKTKIIILLAMAEKSLKRERGEKEITTHPEEEATKSPPCVKPNLRSPPSSWDAGRPIDKEKRKKSMRWEGEETHTHRGKRRKEKRGVIKNKSLIKSPNSRGANQ